RKSVTCGGGRNCRAHELVQRALSVHWVRGSELASSCIASFPVCDTELPGPSPTSAVAKASPCSPVSAPWDLGRVVLLHCRAGFAATWGEIQRDLKDGPAKSIDRLFQGKARRESVPDDFQQVADNLADGPDRRDAEAARPARRPRPQDERGLPPRLCDRTGEVAGVARQTGPLGGDFESWPLFRG